jgi:uncharacterized protein
MAPTLIQNHLTQINKVIKKNDIGYLAVYGSFARGEETPKSDLDLLVSFKDKKSLLDLVGIQQELGDLLGVKVDLITKKGLSKYVKPYIQDDLEVIYAEKS